jgi:cytochrome c oxidase subunit 2
MKSFLEQIKPPLDISTNGHLIDYLFNFTTILIVLFFFLVCLGLFGFSYLYSKKKHPKPLYVHGTSKKHILIVGGLASLVFILIDMQITGISNHDYLNVFINWPKETKEVVRVEVLGQQWAWNFRYAGKDEIFNTEDDIVTLNDLHLPVGQKIVFQITAKDVIHSFYLPNTRLKVDAMPGRISKMWVELTQPGVFDIACGHICGTFHYKMKAKLTVHSKEDYEKWQEAASLHANYATDKQNPDIYWGWQWVANTK